jgi:hypothetical protein
MLRGMVFVRSDGILQIMLNMWALVSEHNSCRNRNILANVILTSLLRRLPISNSILYRVKRDRGSFQRERISPTFS